jgi:hypothetical protein
MGRDRVATAEALAREAADQPVYRGGPRGSIGRPRLLAIGDAQAPLSKFLEILDRHSALGSDGRLSEDVHLVSIGDHFDWGTRVSRDQAASDGLALLAWLCAHASDQATLILGNHDLSRVGELAGFDDATFREAQLAAEADAQGAEAAFLTRFPALPTAEAATRDLATFREPQRTLVTSLLRARRFSAGAAAGADFLLCHAGITVDDLDHVGVRPAQRAHAPRVAAALNAALDQAVSDWSDGEVLAIPYLHQPGHAKTGEGRGIFVHRPSLPDGRGSTPADFEGPPRRRFLPESLPLGLTQAIGHIRDGKCRKLLLPHDPDEPLVDGPLRHLRLREGELRYARGLPDAAEPDAATLLFLDGGMFWAAAADYELLDLATRRAATRR